MLRLWILVTLSAAACHPKPPVDPVTDPGPPPLPPSSGTAIGILLDDATALGLRPDQTDKLRAIDSDLATREDRIASHERPPAGAPNPQAPGPQHRGGGRHRGGHHGSATGAPDPDRTKQERSATESDAIARALEVLDPDQRVTARKLLDAHGYASKPAPTPVQEPQPDPDDDADPAPEP